jgi:toxin FitB
MKFLVDTNILSEPTKPRPDARVEQWIADHGADFNTSSLVIAELLNGLEKLADGERKRHLAPRLERLVDRLRGRILSFNLRVAQEWVRLQAELRAKGRTMSWEDGIIAATARHHGLTLATHNTADFVHAKVRLCDPFTYGVQGPAASSAIPPSSLSS